MKNCRWLTCAGLVPSDKVSLFESRSFVTLKNFETPQNGHFYLRLKKNHSTDFCIKIETKIGSLHFFTCGPVSFVLFSLKIIKFSSKLSRTKNRSQCHVLQSVSKH